MTLHALKSDLANFRFVIVVFFWEDSEDNLKAFFLKKKMNELILNTFHIWMVYLDFAIQRWSSHNLSQPVNRDICQKLLKDREVRYCLALHEGSASEKSGYLTMTTSKIVLGREGGNNTKQSLRAGKWFWAVNILLWLRKQKPRTEYYSTGKDNQDVTGSLEPAEYHGKVFQMYPLGNRKSSVVYKE